MRALGLAVLLLAGCGADDVGEGNATANQIERLSIPNQQPVADPNVSARLQPISPGDVTREGLGGPGCAFGSGGTMLLAATGEDAIARIAGALRHFTHSAPVGPSGGFFEDRQTSVSVGRTDAGDVAPNAAAGWPARITVTNRRTGAQVELEGVWRCDG